MSRAPINLDSADALHAFRLAMGLQLPGSPEIRVEASEGSEGTTFTDFSAEAIEQEGNLPYREVSNSPHTKLKLTPKKLSGKCLALFAEAQDEGSSLQQELG